MKVSIANDGDGREYAEYVVVVTAPEFEKGHGLDSGNASDSALFQFSRHSAGGIGHALENRASPLQIHGGPTGSAFPEGYRAGGHLGIYLPRGFYMIVEDIDGGRQVSFIADR